MSPFKFLALFFTAIIGAIVLVLIRLYAILPCFSPRPVLPRRSEQANNAAVPAAARLLIVLGSGGHTAEMLSMLSNDALDTRKFAHRSYLVSSGDAFSMGKAQAFEAFLLSKAAAATTALEHEYEYGSYDIAVVPRARQIHQRLLTTPFTCAKCLISCLAVMRGSSLLPDSSSPSPSPSPSPKQVQQQKQTTDTSPYPDLILTNGPATAVIAVLAALLLRFCGASGTQGRMRTIYVESWARVRRLSLSGKILVWLVDRFIVQWEPLLPMTYGRGEYLGVLIT